MRTMTQSKKIVIVDDEPNLRKVLGALLRQQGYNVYEAKDGKEALTLLCSATNCLITDLRMPQLDGMNLFLRAKKENPLLQVILLTAYGQIPESVKAVKLGAFDYIEKGEDQEKIVEVVGRAITNYQVEYDKLNLNKQKQIDGNGRYGMIGNSEPMQKIYEILDKIIDTDTTVLIRGESGTGKELVANALHVYSSRKNGPYIKINCAALPNNLVESELFGYEKGAFTGATQWKPGKFELAHKGTLFLDEIAELPLELQAKLLRVIEESSFERIGGVKTIQVDVRLIAASNKNLIQAIQEGKFREDLYYRLNVLPIQLLPLRERKEDISLLITWFLEKISDRIKKKIRMDDEVLSFFQEYSFPGNIRELENLLERASLLSKEGTIKIKDLCLESQSSTRI